MGAFEHNRRSFLFAGASAVVSQMVLHASAQSGTEAGHGYALGPDEGEQLVHFRDRGKICIKVGAATGSVNLAIGTQQVMAGSGIPIHRHLKMDESFYVLEGSGVFVLNDARHSFEKGTSIFIPKNSWHGFENPGQEVLFLWMVTPAGLDGFFRETCAPPGTPQKQLTPNHIRDIALNKYQTEFR